MAQDNKEQERVAHCPDTHPEEWDGRTYMGSDGYTLHLDSGGAFDAYFDVQARKASNNKIEVKPASLKHGFNDFDVFNLPNVHRVCIGHGIKKGDIFNVYCSDGVKLGASWCGEIKQSLANFAATHAQYRTKVLC